MRRIEIAESAERDLEQIVHYIAEDNPHAATRVMKKLRDAIERLAHMPTARPGRVVGTFERPAPGLPYIICFSLAPSSLTVLRIIHGARDWRSGAWPD